MFCRYCGHEVNEGAAVCLNCGKLINSNPKLEKKLDKELNGYENPRTIIYLFITGILLAISVFFYMMSMTLGYAFVHYDDSWGYVFPHETFAIFYLVFSFLTIIFSTFTIIYLIIEKRRNIISTNQVFLTITICLFTLLNFINSILTIIKAL